MGGYNDQTLSRTKFVFRTEICFGIIVSVGLLILLEPDYVSHVELLISLAPEHTRRVGLLL